jgi:hypothetical protein
VVLLPPLLEPRDGSAGFARAAREAGVLTLKPVNSGAFGPQLYRDSGFHLNAVGAAAFTERLITVLRKELPSLVASDVHVKAGDAPVSRAAFSRR